MKKTIAVILVLTVIMSTMFMTTAFAEIIAHETVEDYDFTQIPEPISLDEEAELQLKEAILAIYNYKNKTVDDIVLEYFGTMSDGSMLIRYYFKPASEFTWIPFPCIIGNYVYKYYSTLDEVEVFKNNDVYSIDNAYTDGIINDDVLDEIAQALNFEVYDPNRNVPTEPVTEETITTEPATEETIITEPATEETITDNNEPAEVKDQTASTSTEPVATPDVVQNTNNNSNDTIPTGDSSAALFVLMLIAVISGAVICYTERNCNKIK